MAGSAVPHEVRYNQNAKGDQPTKAIANWFVFMAKKECKTLTHLQLQKLVYVAHGWYLGITGRPLIDEPIEAWQYGPVIHSLYHALKRNGSDAIGEELRELDADSGLMVTPVVPGGDPVESLLQQVWEAYGKLSGARLVDLTHMDGSPWSKTAGLYGGRDFVRGEEIDNQLIFDEYRARLTQNE